MRFFFIFLIFIFKFQYLYAVEFLGKFEQGAFILGKTKPNSKVKIDKFIASSSNIGIAVKDSSILDANNVEIKTVKYCLSAYNKKNEFNGGLINIGSVNCKDFYKFKDIDQFSKIIITNNNKNIDFGITEKINNNNLIEDTKSFASKNYINVIVEIPKGTNEKLSLIHI